MVPINTLLTVLSLAYPTKEKAHGIVRSKQSTFSVGGGGTSTVSASSTWTGSSTLVGPVDNNLPFLDAATVLFQQ